jgi:hypothetical protein
MTGAGSYQASWQVIFRLLHGGVTRADVSGRNELLPGRPYLAPHMISPETMSSSGGLCMCDQSLDTSCKLQYDEAMRGSIVFGTLESKSVIFRTEQVNTAIILQDQPAALFGGNGSPINTT